MSRLDTLHLHLGDTLMNEKEPLLVEIADYVCDYQISSSLAYQTAQLAFLDSLACAILALKVPLCRQLLGPYVEGTRVPLGARVPGTSYELDPIKAAFDIGTLIRWLDYNDTWLALEWGHPSDNLGGILSVADHFSRLNKTINNQSITLETIWACMIKAYEIQGILALNHAFNQVGLDHVILVKIATTAVVATLYHFSKDQIIKALSHAFVDGASLRTYRHAPNVGPRKSWAAGDATSRGVELVWLVSKGEPGIHKPISAKKWGFSDVSYQSKPLTLDQPLGTYVMENLLFKVSYPAEFHAQTALEAAILLHPKVKTRIESIEKIVIETQEAGFKIINKIGPLHNYADRDHSIQYIVAIGLIFGDLKAEDYHDETAKNERIDYLRSKMVVTENPNFTLDYFDPQKRSITNAIQVFFKDGTSTDKVMVEYPLGHKRRRSEAIHKLKEKYDKAIMSHYNKNHLGQDNIRNNNIEKIGVNSKTDNINFKAKYLLQLFDNIDQLSQCPVAKFMDSWVL